MVWLNGFLTLWWCENYIHAVETILQNLNCDLFPRLVTCGSILSPDSGQEQWLTALNQPWDYIHTTIMLPHNHPLFHFQSNAQQITRYSALYCDFPGGAVGKNQPTNTGGTRGAGSIPGSGRSPEVRNGNPLQYFAWKIPWTEEPGGLQSMGLQRIGHKWAHTHSLL